MGREKIKEINRKHKRELRRKRRDKREHIAQLRANNRHLRMKRRAYEAEDVA